MDVSANVHFLLIVDVEVDDGAVASHDELALLDELQDVSDVQDFLLGKIFHKL